MAYVRFVVGVVIIVIVICYIILYNKLQTHELTDGHGNLIFVNLNNRKYLDLVLDSDHCNSSLRLLIVITSYVGHVELRSSHRRAYPHEYLRDRGIRRVFLLAKIPAREKDITQNAIENEQERFGDLVQGNFIEDYRNLSYKHLMGLEWAYHRCNITNYIMKADDDSVFNLNGITELLYKYDNIDKHKILSGYLLKNRKAMRLKANKWFVTNDEYDKPEYPTFLSGWLYITTPEVAQRLVQESLEHSIFWIDDVYVTGILASAVGIKLMDAGEYFLLSYYELLMCCLRDMMEKGIQCEYIAGPNGGDNNLIYKFSDALNKKTNLKKRPQNESMIGSCIYEKQLNPLKNGESEVQFIQL